MTEFSCEDSTRNDPLSSTWGLLTGFRFLLAVGSRPPTVPRHVGLPNITACFIKATKEAVS